MTCIVAIADGERVWMGGDSCGSSNSIKLEVAHSKIFTRTVMVGKKIAPLLIGCCGSFRRSQLLEYSLKIPKMKHGQSFVEWIVTDFADAVRAHFVIKGVPLVNDTDEYDSSFLIGYNGQLYHMHSDFQAFAAKNGEASAGSGTLVAMGSLHATRHLNVTVERRVEMALEAAAELNPFVAAPFNYITLD